MKSWLYRLKESIGRRIRDMPTTQPEYHIYDLIWSIPREYGGMTSAMLYRCWQFRRYGVGRTLTILTLQVGLDVKWAEKHIQEQWRVPKSVRVKNIWDDLREASDASLSELSGNKLQTLSVAERRPGYKKTKPYLHEFSNEAGKVIRREHLRKDGTLLLLVGVDGNESSVTLYDSKGVAIKHWETIQDLYLAWLDWVIDRRPAVLINEHRNISKFLYFATMKGVRTCQVVHGAHQKSTQTPFGELNSRANMVRNLANFDLVSLLTEWQRQDLLALGVGANNLRIMPNTTKQAVISKTETALSRTPKKGVVIARLSSNKQINHALQALARLQNGSPSDLHIYGDGDQRALLEALCTNLALNKHVTFKGHVPGAQEALTDYSFLLFTSQAEGQGLVLLEAMARGCIPISYDMRYGPRDVITHGVDGFLVPPDDIDALAATIRYFIDMPEEKRLTMRRAAIKRAEYFYPENNMRRWRTALNELMHQPSRKRTQYGKGLKAVADNVEVEAGHCTITGRIVGQYEDMTLPGKLVVCTRKKASFLKLETEFEALSDTEKRFTASFELAHMPLRKVDYLDFYIQPIGALWVDKKRIVHALAHGSIQYAQGKVYATQYGNLSMDCRESI